MHQENIVTSLTKLMTTKQVYTVAGAESADAASLH